MTIFLIVFAEALLICVPGAALGLLFAALAAPFICELASTVTVSWTVVSTGFAAAALVALVSIAAPVLSLRSMSIVDLLGS